MSKAQHWIEINKASTGTLYIDSVPLQTIMELPGNMDGNKKFRAYLIGFADSVVSLEKEVLIKRNKYYQYDLQHNWEAITEDDISKPVFFQPKISIYNSVNEAVLVFETNEGRHPDTLVYTDAYGSWGKQKFILKGE
ncbi:MAG: hypothetical protein J0I84_24305 [Terrimonas sp.]|nr:hypothetical protein [Terrimonas sp.]